MDFSKKHKVIKCKEPNDSDFKVCCLFKSKNAYDAYDKACKNLELVEQYGSRCNGHRLHTSDGGERWLARCNCCGSFVLVQESEVWGSDSEYYDYFPVKSIEHARQLNKQYDGYAIEDYYPFKKLFVTNSMPNFRDFYIKY